MSDVQQLSAEVISCAKDAGVQLATAESLTAGLVGATICDVSGASAVYRGGVISYSSDVKAEVLGVSSELLVTRGAVDAEVAMQMAEGTARVYKAEVGISTTGVAGPDPLDGKPVGTVFLGVASPRGRRSRELHCTGDRAAIRQQSVQEALELLLEELTAMKKFSS